MSALAVACLDQTFYTAAECLAIQVGLPFAGMCTDPRRMEDWNYLLLYNDDVLQIVTTGKRPPGPVMVDFASARMQHRRKQGGELLCRACGLKSDYRPSVFDGTAGLGNDAFILADMGCSVTLCERDPIVAALLANGIERAAVDVSLQATAERMRLELGSAEDALQSMGDHSTDVVYLDPMFASRGKSANSKKEMHLFQSLLPVPEPSVGLINSARRVARRRVVVKRALKAAPLEEQKPDYAFPARAIRFDVYTPSSDSS